MNTKTLLTSITLAALFAGTPAVAFERDDIGFDVYEFFNSDITPNDVGYDIYLKYKTEKDKIVKPDVAAKKVSFQKAKVSNQYEFQTINR